jgi:Family of unknown function (DUF6325)
MTYGPIDFLALEFHTEQLKGEILPALLELVEKGIVRVVDLVIIQKYEDGRHEAVEITQLAPDLIEVLDPLNVEVSGIIQVEDIDEIAEMMDNDTTAGLLLVEGLWAIKFGEAVVRAKGRVLAHDRIPFEVVNEAMEIIAQAEAGA